MKKVFIGGSRRLSRLNQDVKRRASKMIDERLFVLVGDANGTDKAIQRFFVERAYSNVTVFFSGSACRNNLGNWPTRSVRVDGEKRDFRYYAAKDLAMSEEADYGLMIWDGESQGTVNNILNLLEHGKKVVVYLSPKKEFLTFRSLSDATELLRLMDPATAKALDRKIGVRKRITAPQETLTLA